MNGINQVKWDRPLLVVFLLVCLVGVGLRAAYVHRPLDHRIRSPWRQADHLQIARNLERDGLNIFYPRIDWREDTPGYVEMELPALPWFGALLFRIFGYSEPLLRVPSLACGLLGLYLFVLLARSMLPPSGVIAATVAFAVNPLLFHLSTSLQPEILMLCLSMLAVILTERWSSQPERYSLLFLAALTTAGAILAKATAAHLGLVLAAAVLHRLGLAALASWRVWLAALIAVGPPAAWYLWARGFWTSYGMSLGLSNGYPFPTADMLLPPTFLVGILKWETLGVFSPFGWILVATALFVYRTKLRQPLVWYGSVLLLYVVAGTICSADWAYYYHSMSAAPGCLLIGAGLSALSERKVLRSHGSWVARWQPAVGWLLVAATVLTLVAGIAYIIKRRDNRPELQIMRECAMEFVPYVPFDGRIVVTGGSSYDRYGRLGAFNISMTFAWMDRRGFNYGESELNPQTLDAIAARGGRYWIVGRSELERNDLLEEAPNRYRLIAECQASYYLYDLRPE